ncbi:MAG: tRNA (adenosine(37)-N6)-dimethylallyltransferase MiaA [Patescibacteria group bacterium]
MTSRKVTKILVIVGPTAVGKSALAVWLARMSFPNGNSRGRARRFTGEIVSADSRQVYRGLDVGTGKLTKREMQKVFHHLLDVASPRRQFSVALYVRKARRAIEGIARRGKLPIVAGGTGLYIDALLGSVSIPEAPPKPALRKRLAKKSATELFAMLRKLDPRRAKTIDRHNTRRLIRAIEIARVLGNVPVYSNVLKNNRVKTRATPQGINPAGRTETLRISAEYSCERHSGLPQSQPPKVDAMSTINIRPLYIGLVLPKKKLQQKIAARLAVRMRSGLIAEVKRLHGQGLSWKRMEELGLEYRYVSRYARGLMSKEEMIEKLKTEMYRYAKRQMRWFKRHKDIKWFTPIERVKIEKRVRDFLKA